jgi:PAS domain S-box-containing protein
MTGEKGQTHALGSDAGMGFGEGGWLGQLASASTRTGVCLLRGNGTIVSWNLGAERITGYPPTAVVNQDYSLLFSGEDRTAGFPPRFLQAAVREGRNEFEGWWRRQDGSQLWVHLFVCPVHASAAIPNGFAMIIEDATATHEAHLSREIADQKHSRAQRMEALGQLTGGVIHDFNNLLMVIGGFARTLKRLAAHDVKGERAISAIELAVERGQSLTGQLLNFSRRQAENSLLSGAEERIRNAGLLIENALPADIRLVIDISGGLWGVRADAGELELALLNLALNCRDAMHGGGTVTLSARNIHLDGPETPARLRGDFVSIAVSDNGAGIPDDVLQKIFDPFFSTKSSEKASGLGLSQVQGFAVQSGGGVTVQSLVGQGTEVVIFLPRALRTVRDSVGDGTLNRAEGGKALLIDDNRDVLEVSALYLQELGYEVDPVDNAQSALRAAEQEAYSVIVSDIVMAGMNGIDLAEAIRKRKPETPIVLVTGYNKVAASIGEQFVLIRKPYHLEDLRRAIARAAEVGAARFAGSNGRLAAP